MKLPDVRARARDRAPRSSNSDSRYRHTRVFTRPCAWQPCRSDASGLPTTPLASWFRSETMRVSTQIRAANAWSENFPVEWRSVDAELFRDHSYLATHNDRYFAPADRRRHRHVRFGCMPRRSDRRCHRSRRRTRSPPDRRLAGALFAFSSHACGRERKPMAANLHRRRSGRTRPGVSTIPATATEPWAARRPTSTTASSRSAVPHSKRSLRCRRPIATCVGG